MTGLIAEGADIEAIWPSQAAEESVLYHSMSYGRSDEISTLLLQSGADPLSGPNPPEVLFEVAMVSAGNNSTTSPPKRRTLMMLGKLLSHPNDLQTNEDIPNPFQIALKWGSLEGTEIALRAGYDVNAPFKWKKNPYERALRPSIPVIFAASRIHSRAVWHESGFIEPNRGPTLRELMQRGADLKLVEADTGSTVLHHVLSGIWWDCPYGTQSYVILCQLVVFLIKNGADPGALDVQGQSPSDIVWEIKPGNKALIQRRAVVWYRSLRMCGLHPAVYDRRYDSRFDRSYWGCIFCAFEAGLAQEVSFVACPWCIAEPYGIRAGWNSHDNWRHRSNPEYKYSSADNLENLGPRVVKEADLYPCCPMFACLWHYTRASSGVRLPNKPGRPMKPYSGLTPNSTFRLAMATMLRSWGVPGIVDPDHIQHAKFALDESDSEEEEQVGDSGKDCVSDESVGDSGKDCMSDESVGKEEQGRGQVRDIGGDYVSGEDQDEDELFYDALEEITN